MSRLALFRHHLAPPSPPPATLGFRFGTNANEVYYGLDNVTFSDHSHGDGWQTMPSGNAVQAAYLTSDGWPIASTLPPGETKFRRVIQLSEPVGGLAPQMQVLFTPNSVSSVAVSGATLDSINIAAGTALCTPTSTQPGGSAWNFDFIPTSTQMTAFSAKNVGDASTISPRDLAQIAAQTSPDSYIRPLLQTWNTLNFGTTAAWGGGTQASPTRFVSLATRNTLTSGEWSKEGTASRRRGDGVPFELIVLQANLASRHLWHNFNANIADDLIDFYADYAAANLTGDYSPEVENEVWNFPDYQAQCAAEAAILGLPGPGERHIQRTLEIFARMAARFALAGKSSKFKPVFAWQNAAGSSVAAYLLDYAPPGYTALKNHITYYATAPYFGNTFGTPDKDSLDELTFWRYAFNEVDAALSFVPLIQTVCAARGVTWAGYEFGQSIITTNGTLNATIQRSDLMRALYAYALDQAKALFGTGDVPFNHYNNVAPLSPDGANFGSWGAQEASMYDADTVSPPQPKAKALRNWMSGIKTLTALQSDLYFVVGDANGTQCGTVQVGRSYGSALTISNANFALNSSTAIVTLANTGALTSGTYNVDFVETLAGYSGSPKTTTLPIRGYTLSTELLTNGNFASAGPPPSLYSGATISGGQANCVNATLMLTWASACTIGQRYRATITLNRTSGQDIRLTNGTVIGANIVKTVPLSSGVQTVTADFVATGTAFTIDASGAVFSGAVTSVSLKHMV